MRAFSRRGQERTENGRTRFGATRGVRLETDFDVASQPGGGGQVSASVSGDGESTRASILRVIERPDPEHPFRG